MSYDDRTLECVECGAPFTFTASEQEFFASKGFTNDPKRCPGCRSSRRSGRMGDGDYRERRQMYSAVCAECGNEALIPFEPRDGRPVYCSECFAKQGRYAST